jgi:hypothetical protein
MSPTSEIDNLTLAWMCDLVDGLVTFRQDLVHEKITITTASGAGYATGKTVDPFNFFYNLGVAGGSTYRVPGHYRPASVNAGLEREGEDSNDVVENDTRETMHPSIRLRMESDQVSYDPESFKAQKGWTCQTLPAWEFRYVKGEGNGAYWFRAEVPAQPGYMYSYPAEREIKIQEHVIDTRENQGRSNFEAALLSPSLKERLSQRNQNILAQHDI